MPALSRKLAEIFTLPPGTAEAGSSIVYIFNAALWVAVAGGLLWLWHWVRTKDIGTANLRLRSFLLSTPILVTLAFGAIFNVSTATYLAYEVPRDIMQDIESAKLFLSGQPAFPLNMTDQIKETLDQDPAPLTLGKQFPAVAKIEKDSYDKLVHEPWTQAHPATMTLLLAALVSWMHVRTVTLLFSLVSVLALLATFRILRKELGGGSAEDSRLWLALTLACLGWFPFWMTLRDGQITFVLTLLLTAGWYFLRHDKNIAAGVCIGIAAALKLFPGFLIVYLLLRRRKAFWPAAVTSGAVLAACFGIMGWQNTLDYFQVVKFVQTYYMKYQANLSLQSVLLSLAPSQEPRWHVAAILARLFLLASLGLAAWLVTRRAMDRQQDRQQDRSPVRALDLEYALFMALVLLVSPLCWDNYLVLLALPATVLIYALRKDGVFAQHREWTALFVVVAAIMAIPEPFGIWVAKVLNVNAHFTTFFFKTPVLAVFGVLFLLWSMRMQLAKMPDAVAVPAPDTTEPQERPVAA